MAAIIFELRITVMLYLNFQRGIVPDNFHVCVAFFKTVRECCTLDPSQAHYKWKYIFISLFYLTDLTFNRNNVKDTQ